MCFANCASQYIYLSKKPTWCTKFCFSISLFHASISFEHHVLIFRTSKFYYTACGIIITIGVRPMYGTATYRCDETRCCIIQFWAPDNEQIVLETYRGRPMHGTATYRCDDTRGCIIQFWPPEDEHMVLETCRSMK